MENNLLNINEAYIGKTENLIEVEKQFNLLIKNAGRGQDLDSRPEVQKINRLIEKQFGMDVYAIHFEQGSFADASTFVIGMKYDLALTTNFKDLVTGSKEAGYRFKPNNNLCVVTELTLGLLKNYKLTGEELTSFILHEIGHNFACCMDDEVQLANKSYVKFKTQELILAATINFGQQNAKLVDDAYRINTNNNDRKEAEERKKPSKLRGWIRGLASVKYNFKDFCKQAFHILTNRKVKPGSTDMSKDYFDKMHTAVQRTPGRKDEVFADTFAAIYGYGKPIIRGLDKIEDDTRASAGKFFSKIFGEDILIGFDEMNKNFFLTDDHPHIVQRINSVKAALNSELTKANLDPKLKQVIKDQIEELNRYMDKITTVYKNESLRQSIRKTFYKTVNEDAPDALTKALEEEIEKEFDEALKK